MRNRIIFFLIGVFILSSGSAYSAENEFKRNNPDGNKYEFARSYISALSYFDVINQRWSKSTLKKKFVGHDLNVIRGSMHYLVLDNSDLRVAKNYMVKYLKLPNSLMRKVADMLIYSCDQDIVLNNQEKNLWQDWLNKKALGIPKPQEEKDFIKAQEAVELKRKESDKAIIKASILLTKVLLSQDNPNDKGRMLAITDKQRSKLLDFLDEYGKEVLDWGLKPGQSTLDASIAVIREVLEDPVYIVHK